MPGPCRRPAEGRFRYQPVLLSELRAFGESYSSSNEPIGHGRGQSLVFRMIPLPPSVNHSAPPSPPWRSWESGPLPWDPGPAAALGARGQRVWGARSQLLGCWSQGRRPSPAFLSPFPAQLQLILPCRRKRCMPARVLPGPARDAAWQSDRTGSPTPPAPPRPHTVAAAGVRELAPRTAENTVWFASCNAWLPQQNSSLVVAPDGRIHARTEVKRQEVPVADIDVDQTTHGPCSAWVSRDRRRGPSRQRGAAVRRHGEAGGVCRRLEREEDRRGEGSSSGGDAPGGETAPAQGRRQRTSSRRVCSGDSRYE